MTSASLLAPVCIGFNGLTVARKTTWQPASACVGQHDPQMNDSPGFGGAWIYPRRFETLPTPPGAKDTQGRPLPTNVKAGEVGSRVILWAHGSAFAITQALDFVWLFGQMLSEQTGQVVLLAEYGLTSGTVHPQQLERWCRTYATLCELYGANNVVLAGDSAGGCLSLATLLNTSATLPPPAALVLFSPWVDLRDDALLSVSMAEYPPEKGGLLRYGDCDYLPTKAVLKTSYAYASSKDRDEPLVSPSTANDAQLKALGRQAMGVDGLPYTTRMFITWGGSEILKDQAMGMAARLSGVGLDVTTYAAEKMPHDSAVVAAGLIYNTGLGFLGVGDYSQFEPTRTWAQFLTWLKSVPGWEGTKVPDGW
uniref:Alpha/beta hydrolase fold-3 domain-containing protein n=1 Tax=Haptolina ericina TaxID=156174 RepID=A0A7S3AP72_9EUKA